MRRINRLRRDPMAPLIPRGILRCASFDEFIGPVCVARGFAIDGRSFDYHWVWVDPLSETPFWRSPAGYQILVLNSESEPAVLVLLAPNGERCGFYVGIELWIDPDHRGQGLGAELVLAMTELLGRSPREGQEATGFSPAGYAAHLKAWRLAHERWAVLRRSPHCRRGTIKE